MQAEDAKRKVAPEDADVGARAAEASGRDEAPAPWDDMVLVGWVARTHGLAGHVVVNPETDFPEERFAPGSRLWLGTAAGARRIAVRASRLQNGRPIVAFAGIDTIEAAERVLGAQLRITEADLRPLEEGTYYHHQLVGCTVNTDAGVRVGEVRKVDGGGAGASLLVVEGPGGEVLIPLTPGICTNVDVVRKRIVVTPPDGLLDLNVTRRPAGGPGSGRRA